MNAPTRTPRVRNWTAVAAWSRTSAGPMKSRNAPRGGSGTPARACFCRCGEEIAKGEECCPPEGE